MRISIEAFPELGNPEIKRYQWRRQEKQKDKEK